MFKNHPTGFLFSGNRGHFTGGRAETGEPDHTPASKADSKTMYVDYSESKYRLRIFLAHPPDYHFAHVH